MTKKNLHRDNYTIFSLNLDTITDIQSRCEMLEDRFGPGLVSCVCLRPVHTLYPYWITLKLIPAEWDIIESDFNLSGFNRLTNAIDNAEQFARWVHFTKFCDEPQTFYTCASERDDVLDRFARQMWKLECQRRERARKYAKAQFEYQREMEVKNNPVHRESFIGRDIFNYICGN